jgi:subtilisin family serine protease
MLLVVLVCLTLMVVPLLMACTIRNSTPTPIPTPVLPSTIATPSSITLPTGNDVKIDSVLLDVAAAYNAGGQAAAEQKARETGLLNDQDELRLTLVLTDTNTQPVADKVKELGGKVAASAENLIDVLFPLQTAITSLSGTNSQNFFQELAALSTVKEVRVTPTPRNEGFTYPAGTTIADLQPLIQALIVEGVAVSGADKWHAAGITGKGVKIGIIDGGFGGYEALLGKELPQRVTLKSFLSNGTAGKDPHGTAVAEIVYAMAPEAELFLCPISSDASYAQAVKYLVDEAKVDVIQQSQGWHDTRGDGSGFRADQVNYAHDNGVVYVKSAGNEADSHYTGTYTPSSTGRHQFASNKDRIRVQGAGDGYILLHLIWDAWTGEAVNYDLYLVDEAGNRVASSRNVQGTQKPPYEYVEYQGKAGVRYYAVIEAVNTTRAVRLDLFGKNTALETVGAGSTPASSISNPGDARGSFTAGAVNFEDDKLEEYSGQGPTLDGRLKPDIAGLARVTTAAYKGEPFYGTSAAAPHVSGAAALVVSAQPEATPDQVRAFLEKNAKDIEEAGPDNKAGYGRLALGPPENARSSPEPVPSAAAAAANGPPITDNFSSTQSGLQNGGETTYASGRYVVAPNAPNRAAWSTYGSTYATASIEATLQLTAPTGGAGGLVFWQTGNNDYYAFLVTNDGFYQIARLQGGRWSALTPWQQSPALVANGPNKLGVTFNGRQITLQANGQNLGVTQAPAAGNGRVGFIATNFAQPGVSAAFTDFKLTPSP